VAISDDEVYAVGKQPGDFVHVPEKFRAQHGNKVLAGFEVTHQLHCLVRYFWSNITHRQTLTFQQNLLRKMTYFDHYYPIDEVIRDTAPIVLRAHVGQSRISSR
jgi:hypothetical protein